MSSQRNNQEFFDEAMGALQMYMRKLCFSEEAIVSALCLAIENEKFLEEAIIYLYEKHPSEEEFLTMMESMDSHGSKE